MSSATANSMSSLSTSMSEKTSPFSSPIIKPSSAPSPVQGQIFWSTTLSKYVEVISHSDNKVVTAYILDSNGKRIVSDVSKHTSKIKYVRRVMRRTNLAWDFYLESFDTIPSEHSAM